MRWYSDFRMDYFALTNLYLYTGFGWTLGLLGPGFLSALFNRVSIFKTKRLSILPLDKLLYFWQFQSSDNFLYVIICRCQWLQMTWSAKFTGLSVWSLPTAALFPDLPSFVTANDCPSLPKTGEVICLSRLVTSWVGSTLWCASTLLARLSLILKEICSEPLPTSPAINKPLLSRGTPSLTLPTSIGFLMKRGLWYIWNIILRLMKRLQQQNPQQNKPLHSFKYLQCNTGHKAVIIFFQF